MFYVNLPQEIQSYTIKFKNRANKIKMVGEKW